LHPSPQSWLDLEQSVAKLLEQTVMQAIASLNTKNSCEGSEEASEAGLAEAGKVLTSRAAKRLRQRERRKLCKKGIISPPLPAGAASPLGCGEPGKLGGFQDAATWASVPVGPALLLPVCDKTKTRNDDGASEHSVSTATGGRSVSTGEVTCRRTSQDSPRAADSMSEASGQSGSRTDDIDEGLRRRRDCRKAVKDEWRRCKAPSMPWWDVSDEEDAVEDDLVSTGLTSSSLRRRGDDQRTPCSAGSFESARLDDVSLKDALEEAAENRLFERQGSCCTELSILEMPPPSRQVTDCATPTHLWPSTPELSPRQSPLEGDFPPPLSLFLAPGFWDV